jgi:thiamine-phosphate pyrophosphorylase
MRREHPEGYTDPMLRYAITDGTATTPQGTARLLANAQRWAAQGIDFIQLRERTLESGALLDLTTALVAVLQQSGSRTKLLLNSRPDIAIAAGADGVHLTARPGELTPAQVRLIFSSAGEPEPSVSISCHTLPEVSRAAKAGANLILFGPVFEKRVNGVIVAEGVGLELLKQACVVAGSTPALALGGVTLKNMGECLAVGAIGGAGIRLFK